MEMKLCGMALCLETASLQRWKCETLIDHFNWKPFVLQATEGLRANARIKTILGYLQRTGGNFNNKNKKAPNILQQIFSTLVATALFVQSEQQQQINNEKLWGIFFRINVGLIIIRDPITAFVPHLSHPPTLGSSGKMTFAKGKQRKQI